jgi:pilus assembly protein CpaF
VGISEIMVSGPNQVYVERDGALEDTGITFQDEEHLMRIIDRMVHPMGRRVDSEHPTADARLPDGSRINVVIPPVSIDGPCLTIRKFLKNKLTIEELIELGSINPFMAEFLRACVVARLNILTGFIPGNERFVTIEDAAELQLQQKYIVRLETKNPDVDGKGEVTQRELLRNALRMRPDRIIIGEVRGGEAFDLLNAMNTGHEGSLSTIHANSPRDGLSRMENMVLMANLDLPQTAIREQIASALHLIIQIARFRDGTRRITHVTEVSGMEGTVITLQDIFRFNQRGIDEDHHIVGELQSTGIRPTFTDRFAVAGVRLPDLLFQTLSER